MTEKELGALYYNDYDTNLEFGEFCYNKGRADRDKEIAEHNVFFSNKPIEDIVLEARADERAEIIAIVKNLKDSVPVNRVLDDIIKDKPKELGMLIAYDNILKELEE